jgi:class 3 adenylate cyclase/CHASE2 domain-containing sensor protein
MTRARQRLLILSAILGLALTICVVIADAAGLLDLPERVLYDLRARRCQFFAPRPTDRLIHLDIDDPALESIGEWPWPRNVEAQLVDEIDRAGVKAMAWDVIFAEPQPIRYEPQPNGTFVARDDDAAFADAIRRSGKVLMPVSIEFNPPPAQTPVQRAVFEALSIDPEMTADDLSRRLRTQGFSDTDLAGVDDFVVRARVESIRKRVWQIMSHDEHVTFEQLRLMVLPKLDPRITGSPLLRVLDAQYRKADAQLAAAALARPVTAGAGPLLVARSSLPNVGPLIHAAGTTGFVDFVTSPDGAVRDIPLWAEYDGRQYPQMSLSLACLTLGVPLSDVKITPDRVTIPRPAGNGGGEIVIPVRSMVSAQISARIGALIDIPFFGNGSWQSAYDYPRHEAYRQHVSINAVWEACQSRQKIALNDNSIDRAISVLLDDDADYKASLAPDKGKAYRQHLPPDDDFDSRAPIIEQALSALDASGIIQQFAAMKESDLNEKDRRQRDEIRDAAAVLKTAGEKNRGLQKQLADQRAGLKLLLRDKATLIGWVATGKTDFVVTPVVRQCPGVVVHGVIFNAIVSGWFIKTPGAWAGVLLTLLIGGVTTAGVSLFEKPQRALALTGALVVGYALINGFIFYDWWHLNVPIAAPIAAGVVVWPTCTLMQLVSERTQRASITRRFSGYVDPALVDYALEHPEKARFDGEVREMTVVFTDIASFTTMSEQIGERVVALLNYYLEQMIPVARGRGGYVNKFIGDGMMLFFGAPRENSNHAIDAVNTVLEMMAAVGPCNEGLKEQDLPPVSIRIGVSTGKMVVGDAGSKDRSDYTVLGDAVNLGSRLESANKAIGTSILISQRTRELTAGRFLIRPVGRLRVVGRSQGEMAYEPLCPTNNATERDHRLAALTDAMVENFSNCRLKGCLAAVDAMERAFGPSKLTQLYRSLCDGYLADPEGEKCDGQIVLQSK